jgi:hypothetical protein
MRLCLSGEDGVVLHNSTVTASKVGKDDPDPTGSTSVNGENLFLRNETGNRRNGEAFDLATERPFDKLKTG